MKVFIDGKEVECLNDVKVIHEEQLLDVETSGKEIYGELHITLNSEGVIADTFRNRSKYNTYSSMWKTLEDIVEETH